MDEYPSYQGAENPLQRNDQHTMSLANSTLASVSVSSISSYSNAQTIVLDKLTLEMFNNIKEYSKNLSSLGITISSIKLEKELNKIKSESYAQKCPEVQHCINLFKKYSDLANIVKYAKISEINNNKNVSGNDGYNDRANGGDNYGDLFFNNEIPRYAYEGTAEQLAGWDALKKNIFWLRAGTTLFSFLSFIVVATVPHVNSPKVYPHDLFVKNCPYYSSSITGFFDFRPFQTAIAAAILVYIHSLAFLVYYILPVDSDHHKFIPGLETFFEKCVCREQIVSGSTTVAIFCKASSKYVEFVVDLILVVIVIFTLLVASIQLERGARFDNGSTVTYYTLGTFYDTFSHTSPDCVSTASPTTQIRAGLSMLYIDLFFLVWSSYVSFRSLLHVIHREPGSLSNTTVHFNILPSNGHVQSEESKISSVISTRKYSDIDYDDDVVEVSL